MSMQTLVANRPQALISDEITTIIVLIIIEENIVCLYKYLVTLVTNIIFKLFTFEMSLEQINRFSEHKPGAGLSEPIFGSDTV